MRGEQDAEPRSPTRDCVVLVRADRTTLYRLDHERPGGDARATPDWMTNPWWRLHGATCETINSRHMQGCASSGATGPVSYNSVPRLIVDAFA